MERTLIKGTTTEEKLASIEMLLQQFRRKLGTKVVGIIPPVPILHRQLQPEADGTLFLGVCPVNGLLTRMCVRIGAYTKDTAALVYTITSNGDSHSIRRNISNEIEVFALDLPIAAGDVMRITCDPVDAVSDFSVGLLVDPHISNTRQVSHLLENVLALEEKENA